MAKRTSTAEVYRRRIFQMLLAADELIAEGNREAGIGIYETASLIVRNAEQAEQIRRVLAGVTR